MTESVVPANRERVATVFSGWTMLPISLLLFFGGIAMFITSLVMGQHGQPVWGLLIIGVLSFIAAIISFSGYFALQPNEARVLVLFGEYRGTVRESGFHWANPFYSRGCSSDRRAANTGDKAPCAVPPYRPVPRLAAGAQHEQRQAEGERQARQPDRDRRGGGLARAGHRPGDVRRGRLRELRPDPERVGHAPPGQLLCLRPRRGERDHAAQRGGRGVRGAAEGTAGAAGQGRRGGGGGAADAPGLRAGDRAGDAAPAAGRGGDRRAAEDRARRGEHGGHGA